MFREVNLPTGVTGRLLLHSMPGWREPLENVWAASKQEKITAIVRLTDLQEVNLKSPSYGAALQTNQVPFPVLPCEIPDYGVPSNRKGFWLLVQEVASRLRSGEVILVHCGAGIGRTGTFAACVLVALGQAVNAATNAVSQAGSVPETPEQTALVSWCASLKNTEP